jgi:hypothetical protein
VKTQKIRTLLKVKTRILFYGDNPRTVALTVRQMKFDAVKDHGQTFSLRDRGKPEKPQSG